MHNTLQKQLLLGSTILLLVLIPATLFLSQQKQESRSRAAASTKLYYAPSSTAVAPVQKNVGDTVSFDVMVDPGSNLPSVIKLEMDYDPTKFQANPAPFLVNASAFPTTIEGPVVQSGKVLISVSIGSDATKAIQTVTKVGTLTLTAIAPTTTTPTILSFGSISQVLSLAKTDQANENVLSTTGPAYVSLVSSISPTIASTVAPTTVSTIAPTTNAATPTTSVTQNPSATITTAPTAQPTTSTATTTLSFTVLMHGIGSSGDNANPNASDFSNKSPLHPDRNVTISVYNDKNQLTATATGILSYKPTNGNYTGSINFGNSIPLGDYTVRIKEDTHLGKLVPGIHHILPLQNNVMASLDLIAGDVNNDNILNILDYNTLINCYSDLLPAVSCTDTAKGLSDLNDDDHVNQIDYNLFLREITVQNGN